MKIYFNSILERLEKWGNGIVSYLPKLLLALVVFLIFYYLAKSIRKYSLTFYSKIFKKNKDIAKIISLVTYIILIISGIFLALEIVGLESFLTRLLAGAGVIGIVAGFAFKDIASNAFAGFLLNILKPFKEGDWVSLSNHFGIVNDIGLITTTLKTISGQEVFVPNQLIYSHAFTNYSNSKKRRIILQSGVSYDDDLDHVKKVALDEISQIENLLKKEEIDFYFTNIGAYSYNFEIRFWIKFNKQTDYLNAMSDTIMRIKKRFELENINIAYPVQTLDFDTKKGVNIFNRKIEAKK